MWFPARHIGAFDRFQNFRCGERRATALANRASASGQTVALAFSMGDPMKMLEYKLSATVQKRVTRSKNFWGERYPHMKPDVELRRERGAADRLRLHQQAQGKLPPITQQLSSATANASGAAMQWRPITGLVILSEPMPPILPVMEAPERRNGRRVEKAKWFAHPE